MKSNIGNKNMQAFQPCITFYMIFARVLLIKYLFCLYLIFTVCKLKCGMVVSQLQELILEMRKKNILFSEFFLNFTILQGLRITQVHLHPTSYKVKKLPLIGCLKYDQKESNLFSFCMYCPQFERNDIIVFRKKS